MTKRGGRGAISRRQQRRLYEMLAFAAANSPFYQRRFSLQRSESDLRDLPPVTKAEIMAEFDQLVTDPAATEDAARAFMAKERAGEAFLGRYLLCETSGSTGSPGIFLQDRDAMAVYQATASLRGYSSWLSLPGLWRAFALGARVAVVVATGGHYAGSAWLEWASRNRPWLGGRASTRVFSVLTPVRELVRELNGFRPAVLIGYPTAILVLADEQASGRLRVAPAMAITAGEWLGTAARARIAGAFHCPVRDVYAASEFLTIALDCGHGWLHVNEDWVILEAVDKQYHPVPHGEPSSTVLLTNLVNRVQPLIRYDLGDSIVVKPEPCACGNPLQALKVEGRKDDILRFPGIDGRPVAIVPMAVAAVVEETPGVDRYQIIQTGKANVTILLAYRPGVDSAEVWKAVEQRLAEFFRQHDVGQVVVALGAQEPGRDPRTGKFRQVWAEIER